MDFIPAFTPGERSVASIIVWQLRMPRTALAVMVGSSLAVAGVVMQGLTRNPLAEPGILGVNAGASLADRDAGLLMWVVPFLVAGLVLALASGLTLNALALGEEQAKALGVSPGRTRALALTSITLLCGASTAAVGPISFIGLVVPHVLRLALGADQRKLLAVSVVAGPVLLLTADILGRVILESGEMEAGVVTAFIGGPVLLLMVIQRMGVSGR